MNFRRVLIVSGSHLLKRTVASPATASVVNSHLWKRDRTTVAAPASSSSVDTTFATPSAAGRVKVDLLATNDGSFDSAQKAKLAAARQRKKRKVLEKLRNLKEKRGKVKVKETLNAFITREEEDDVTVTQADLLRWAKLLDKEGKSRHALEIFEWMESEKMTFSPTQLATFVELIGKTKGYDAAKEYFNKVDPNFNNMDSKATNFPSYQKLVNILFEGYRIPGTPLCKERRTWWM